MIQELKARPLVLLLGGLLFGLGFPGVSWIFGIVALVCFLFKQKWLGVLSLGTFSAGFLLLWREEPPLVPAGPFSDTIVIRSFPTFMKGDRLYQFQTVQSPSVQGVLNAGSGPLLSPFTVLSVEGMVTSSKMGNLHPSVWSVRSSVPLFDFLVQSQQNAIERTNEMYGKEDGSWVTALTFNFPTDLSHDEKADLRFNGTYHLVSASGMHVWVIALLLHFLLVQAGVPRHW
ncbi:MAG: ComEC/Rec2 family competence protein, partial [Armatimonadota bacterium]